MCPGQGRSGEGTESIPEMLFSAANFPRPTLQQGPCRSTGAIAMIKADLSDVYRDCIACLNAQDWPKLEQFVSALQRSEDRDI